MKEFTFRFLVAVFAFIVGVFITSMMIFNDFSQLRPSDIQPPNDIMSESRKPDDDVTRFSNEDEDYAVYSAILSKYKYIFVQDYTSYGFLAYPMGLKNDYPEITLDIIGNYESSNGTKRDLENKFKINGEVRLISWKELNLFESSGWWRFHRKYPKAQGVVSFSAIGFNKEKTAALVNVSYICGFLCGHGDFILLKKINGIWLIDREIELWVS